MLFWWGVYQGDLSNLLWYINRLGLTVEEVLGFSIWAPEAELCILLHSDLSKKIHLFLSICIAVQWARGSCPSYQTKYFPSSCAFYSGGKYLLEDNDIYSNCTCGFWRLKAIFILQQAYELCIYEVIFPCMREVWDLSVFLTPLLKWLSHCSVSRSNGSKAMCEKTNKQTFSKAASVFAGNCEWCQSKTEWKC